MIIAKPPNNRGRDIKVDMRVRHLGRQKSEWDI